MFVVAYSMDMTAGTMTTRESSNNRLFDHRPKRQRSNRRSKLAVARRSRGVVIASIRRPNADSMKRDIYSMLPIPSARKELSEIIRKAVLTDGGKAAWPQYCR